MSWNEVNALTFMKNEVLFYLHFEQLQQSGKSLGIVMSSNQTAAEAYSLDNRTIQTSLKIMNSQKTEEINPMDNGLNLMQNVPNPFSDFTTISFYLNQGGTATLSIYDLSGRILWKEVRLFNKGLNEVTVHKSDLGLSGVLYYSLETQTNIITKKMIAID